MEFEALLHLTAQRNPVFPDWAFANFTLSRVILPLLGVYPSFEGCEVKVSLLPPKVVEDIPPEHLDLFNERYRQFVLWAYQEVFHADLLEQFMYQPCDEVLFTRMGEAFRQRIEAYNIINYPTYERKFLEFMGIDPIISIS